MDYEKVFLLLLFWVIMIAGYANEPVTVRYKAVKDIPTNMFGIDIGSNNMHQQASQQGFKMENKIYYQEDYKLFVCFDWLFFSSLIINDKKIILVTVFKENAVGTGRASYWTGINLDLSPNEELTEAIDAPICSYIWTDSKGNTLELYFKDEYARLTIANNNYNQSNDIGIKNAENENQKPDRYKGVKIENGVLKEVPKDFKGSFVVESGVKAIDKKAFAGCTGVTSVTIPEGVTNIGYCAFKNCTSLTSVTIPESVTSIGYGAFYECKGLRSVTIPEGVKEIYAAFEQCSSLTNVTLPKGIKYIGERTFRGCTSLTHFEIPFGVEGIDSYAFEACSGLTRVTIPESVTIINKEAFRLCTNLKSVTLPNSLKEMGGSVFESCTSLTSVILPNRMERFGGFDFADCPNLYNTIIVDTFFVHLPSTYQGAYTIPSGIKKICDGAFCDCTGLTSVTIPEGVTSIDLHIFIRCTNLTSVRIPESVTSFNAETLFEIYIKEPIFNRNVFGFLPKSFRGEYTIASGIKTIGESAFIECDKLTSVTIPESVTSIGAYAFVNCENLRFIYVPKGSRERFKEMLEKELWDKIVER